MAPFAVSPWVCPPTQTEYPGGLSSGELRELSKLTVVIFIYYRYYFKLFLVFGGEGDGLLIF